MPIELRIQTVKLSFFGGGWMDLDGVGSFDEFNAKKILLVLFSKKFPLFGVESFLFHQKFNFGV